MLLEKTLVKAISFYGMGSEILADYLKEIGFLWPPGQQINWCGLFMAFVCQSQGFSLPHHFQVARKWLTAGAKVLKPQTGDIVILWRKSPSSWMGHVGFFIRQENNMWWILGGCQGGIVSIRSYPAHKVLGIRRLEKS